MPAPIVYEGVVPRDGGGGTLFKGIKFWISHHVPMRTTYIQNIKSNGGEVVPLEKNADYLLVDHLKHHAAPGSYSYKFIDDSLEAGTLKPIEDYQRAEPSRQTRPVGSSVPKKGTRTPFTAEDDVVLSRWVAEHEKLGMGIQGNAIYQELEKKNPRHTWQSWRSRWKGTLQYLPRPPISDGEPSPPPPPPSLAPPPSTAPSTSPSRPRPRRAVQSSAASGARNRFTPEEDGILLEYIHQCRKDKRSLSGNKIFEELAEDFPQHTMHSWRDRWLRHLKPLLESQRDEGGASDGTSSKSAPRGKKAASTSHAHKESDRQELLREKVPIVEELKDQNPSHIIDKQEDEEDDEDEDEFENQPLPEPSRENAEAPSPVPSREPQDEPADGDEDRLRSPSQPSDGIPLGSPPYPEERDFKQQFNADYQDYADQAQSQAHWWLTVKGKTFELWQLWQAVESQKVEPEERDWQQISETLGFDWVEDDTIPDEVRRCYEVHLAEFEEALMNFDEQSEEEETQVNAILGAPVPSLPPSLPPLKRSYATALEPNHAYPNSSPKRPRHDRDEVPSTPDEKNGTSHLRRRALPPKLGSPSLASPRRRQDFRFDPAALPDVVEPQMDEQVESQVNITPSQQLQLEFNSRPEKEVAAVVTPTPARTTRPIRSPFIEDDPDDPDDITPRASAIPPSNVPSPSLGQTKPKRRSLPKSFAQSRSPRARANGSPSSAATNRKSPAAQPPSEPPAPPVKETPEDVIDFYMSLGYARANVVRALDATTWVPGLASQLMEMLKSGESLPQNWRGVWTQKDDEALRAVYAVADVEPQQDDAKEKRKRDRKREKLEKKHTGEGMDMRIKFLEANGVGGRGVIFVDKNEANGT